jgi:APA family basic amino acid/polyamine antiporter
MALRRELGFLDVFAMASGAMISSGLFVLPAIAYAEVGPGLPLCYLLAAVMIVPAVVTKAELMTAMPKAGGTYFFVDRSLGPGFGTLAGTAAWASLSFKSAFALLGIGAAGAHVWGWDVTGWEVKALAAGFCVAFSVVNVVGVKYAGRVQVGLVAFLLIVLAGYSMGGVRAVDLGRFAAPFPRGWLSLLSGAGMVFISFGGVTKVATMSEEVRRPGRDLVAGMFAAWAVGSALYVIVVFVTVGVLPADAETWRLPLSQAAGRLWGPVGGWVLWAAAMGAFLTTGNAGILAASRTLMAMSQDELVPVSLGVVSEKRGTPTRAIVLTSAFMVAAMVLPLGLFVKAASAMMILLFVFVMLALVLMRESRIPTYRPKWRCPLYPWLQVAGLVCYAFLLVELGTPALAVAGCLMGVAVLWYFFYAKLGVLRESALVHLASRLAGTDFGDHDLEAELSRVARQQDAGLQDRFDRLIERCTVLDLPGPVSREEAFRTIAESLGREIGRAPEQVYRLLLEREDISSTVVRPGLAIPHLILQGLESFAVLLVRSRSGVIFSDGQPPVRAAFVIAASPDERNFYLQCLMAIAEIAQDPGFDAKWGASGTLEALREVVLAAERRREHPR